MLILGALHGERSLRGMWMWGCKHWGEIARPLGFLGNPHPPVYNTVWYVVSGLKGEDLQALGDWMVECEAGRSEALSVDGKVQAGSRRLQPSEKALRAVRLRKSTEWARGTVGGLLPYTAARHPLE
jgi:hypothetical protein